MFVLAQSGKDLFVYDTTDGVTEKVTQQDVLDASDRGLPFANIGPTQKNFDSVLCNKIIYGADAEGTRRVGAYLSYECTIVYKQGHLWVIYGEQNPCKQGLKYLILGETEERFSFMGATDSQTFVLKEQELTEDCVIEYNVKDWVDKPQRILDYVNYIAEVVTVTKLMDKIHEDVMHELMRKEG